MKSERKRKTDIKNDTQRDTVTLKLNFHKRILSSERYERKEKILFSFRAFYRVPYYFIITTTSRDPIVRVNCESISDKSQIKIVNNTPSCFYCIFLGTARIRFPILLRRLLSRVSLFHVRGTNSS
jgi:hypothetical protein